MLVNLVDAVKAVNRGWNKHTASGEAGNIPSPNYIKHALRILCFVVHLSQYPHTSQYIDGWKTLGSAVSDLVYRALAIEVPSFEDLVHRVAEAVHLLPQGTIEVELVKSCLVHIQQQDVKAAFPDWSWRMEAPPYEEWASKFDDAGAIFDNNLIRLISTIHVASLGRGADASDIDKYYRVRRLDLVKNIGDFLSCHSKSSV